MLTASETARLVERALAGEPTAFSVLVREHLRAAYVTALSVVGRPSDAEDVAQDAFLVAFERLESCREPARFSGWLLAIVRNRARNWVERRRLRDVAPRDPQGEIPSTPEPADVGVRKRLLEALETLTPAQREVLLLHELEGWSHAEIAEAVEGSEVMSRQHLLVARRKMREKLDELESTEVTHGK